MNKHLLTKLLIICAVIFAASCSEDKNEPAPDITYLGASKSANILFGEEITLTASSSGNTFQWNYTGGEIQGEGKAVKWIAPNKIGTYSVSVSNGAGSTQSKELTVVGKYFFPFDSSSSGWSYDSNTTDRFFLNGILTVSAKGEASGSVYGFVPENIVLPYSLKTSVAIKTDNWDDLDTKTVNLIIYLNPTEESTYIRGIQLQIVPGKHLWTAIANMSDGARIGLKNVADTDIFTANNQFHTISMSVTATKSLIINIDETEVANIDLSSYNNELILNRFAYSASAGLTLLADDFYLTTDNTILK